MPVYRLMARTFFMLLQSEISTYLTSTKQEKTKIAYAGDSGWYLLLRMSIASGPRLYGGYWTPKPVMESPSSPAAVEAAIVGDMDGLLERRTVVVQ